MDTIRYFRKPFVVEAVEITDDNIKELAHLIGTIQTKDDGTVYIKVDRTLVPNIQEVYIGFWLTKTGNNNVRCYRKRIFDRLFAVSDSEIEQLVSRLNSTDVVNA